MSASCRRVEYDLVVPPETLEEAARVFTTTMPVGCSLAFGFIQLELDAEGKGTGLVYVAASFGVNDDGQLIIESFGTAPVSISTIERQ